jgi:hypothetical protein
MDYCKLFVSSFNSSGISISTVNRSVASLDLHSVAMYGPEFEAFAQDNNFEQVLWFSRLSVPSVCQNHGEGTFLMNHLCEICDCEKLWILNGPNPYRPRDKQKLLDFYTRYRFEPCYQFNGFLIRRPLLA